MDAQVFWDVIGNYNRQTWIIQIALLIFLLIAVALSYKKNKVGGKILAWDY